MAFYSLLDTFHLVFSMYLVYSFILEAIGFTQAAANVLWCVFFSFSSKSTLLNAAKEPQGMVYPVRLLGLRLKIPCFQALGSVQVRDFPVDNVHEKF